MLIGSKRIIWGGLVLALQCTVAGAQAPAAAAERSAPAAEAPRARTELYPWDDRMGKCKMPEAQAFPMCAYKPWPEPVISEQRVGQLWKTGQWPILERAMADLSTSDAVFADGTSHADLAYRVLMSMARESDRSIADWRAALPASGLARVAEAEQLLVKAWAARGNGFARTVSPEAWQLFAQQLQEAEGRLLEAPASVRNTPVWHHVMLKVAREGRGKTDAQQVFLEATKRWPRELGFYTDMAMRLVPKWGGSWAQVESFIAGATRSLQASEGQSTYARLYVQIESQNEDETTAMDWARMRQGFEDWIARDAWPTPRNWYASYACRARDKTAFAQAIRHLPKESVRSYAWLKGYSYEACLRWAGV